MCREAVYYFVSALRDCYSDGSSSRELPFYELQKMQASMKQWICFASARCGYGVACLFIKSKDVL